jgi:hypothetical protein
MVGVSAVDGVDAGSNNTDAPVEAELEGMRVGVSNRLLRGMESTDWLLCEMSLFMDFVGFRADIGCPRGD